MMRIAGRSSDGKAKAIQTDKDGRLNVSLPDIERAVLINSGLKTEYYNTGVEEKKIVEGYAWNNGTASKESDYLKLTVGGNPTDSAVRTFVFDESFDLTDVNWLELDYEMTGTAGYNSVAYFSVGVSKLLSHSDSVVRKNILLINGVPIQRNTIRLNVSEISGKHFIRVHLVDTSTVVDVPAEMKIYGISASNKPTAGIGVLNKNGSNPVKLTAELDDNGQAVLRIVDAAPAGYDPASDSIRVSNMPKKRKKQLQIPLSNMSIGNNDITVNSALNTLAKVTSISFSVGGVAAPATTGTHAIQIYDKSIASVNLLYSITAAYWDNLQVFRTRKANGTEDSGTTFEILQQIINRGLYFGDNTSADNPLVIRYKNDTNAVRTNTAFILIDYIEESIG